MTYTPGAAGRAGGAGNRPGPSPAELEEEGIGILTKSYEELEQAVAREVATVPGRPS
jgi:hypothetical protein